jgi:hypothetical protein
MACRDAGHFLFLLVPILLRLRTDKKRLDFISGSFLGWMGSVAGRAGKEQRNATPCSLTGLNKGHLYKSKPRRDTALLKKF